MVEVSIIKLTSTTCDLIIPWTFVAKKFGQSLFQRLGSPYWKQFHLPLPFFFPLPFPLDFAILGVGPTHGPLVLGFFFFPFLTFSIKAEVEALLTLKTLSPGLITPFADCRELTICSLKNLFDSYYN